MSARKVYSAQPYTERDLLNQNRAKSIFLKEDYSIIDDLIDKWRPYFGFDHISFLVHEYELAGATYGIQLVISVRGYTLQTYIDSGYSKGYIIKEGNLKELGLFIEGFSSLRHTFN